MTKKQIKPVSKSKKKLTSSKGLLAYHIATSLVSIAPHPHTGRPLHRRHTSHGVLMIALVLTGVLLFNNLGALRAAGLQASGTTTVTVSVGGNPPTVGATITFPSNGSITESELVQVAGDCPINTLVATYNNGFFAGSSMCQDTGTYKTIIQLAIGPNQLQSQNYDGINQPGPVTQQVLISRVVPVNSNAPIVSTTPKVAAVAADIAPDPKPPVIPPAPQPTVNPCFDTSELQALNPSRPTIIANCIKRNIFSGEPMTLPIMVIGGTAPYALFIDWGDGTTDLKTVLDTKYNDYLHTYTTAGIKVVTLKTTDANGTTSYLETVVQVNGTTPAANASPIANFTNSLSNIWTEAPVPLYVAAVTLVLGFWVGDIFQRLFSKEHVKALQTIKKKVHPHRRRNA